MKNRSIITLTLIALMSLSAMDISAYSNKPYSAKATKDKHQTTMQNKRPAEKKVHAKTKKPEYYRLGQSDGLQNWPGKTIDAGMNTRMLSTNSASYMGNDISF